MSTLTIRLNSVRERIDECCKIEGIEKKPELLAVSKTKPIELLQEAYEAGQRDFGENYLQEMVQKSQEMAEDIRWHFIGHLQSNKCNLLAKCLNIGSFQCLDTIKLANQLNKVFKREDRILPVYIQVNTSGEASKSGVKPDEVVELAVHIAKECENLKILGLMTIGAPEDPEFECFKLLGKCRDEVCETLGVSSTTMGLSMGMSGDFEAAIKMGSSCVRVGSTIFGVRAKKVVKK
eukprot:TRINITY_DN774566_c0_g1_i1.p1 TRINITY_DN774566_c0_g1~~TRINITY_DN774566_c0_g1_i1.p1  ORF type:complete len:235 (-),score=53.77 TRINITY_DN774566_c0_g1_i1:195-899(-)